MFPYQRLYDLFDCIHHNSITLPHQLASFLGVSVRTIRSDMMLINQKIENYQMKILLKRNQGYKLFIDDSTMYQQFLSEYRKNTLQLSLETSQERIQYLICSLILKNKEISLQEMMQHLFVSENTLQNYLRIVKKQVGHYDLKLLYQTTKNIQIVGTEANKRKCLRDGIADYTTATFTSMEIFYLQNIHIEELKKIIIPFLKKYHVFIHDLLLKRMTVFLGVSLLRVQQGFIIEDEPLSIEMSSFLEDMIDHIEKSYDLYLPQSEKRNIQNYFQTSFLQNTDDEVSLKVRQCVHDFLNYMDQNYHFHFQDDQQLQNDLFQHLLKSMTMTGETALMAHSLLETIKTHFPLPYEMSFVYFQRFHQQILESDVAYIALHIAAAIERHTKNKKVKNVLLVSDMGQAIINILKTRIENYFHHMICIVDILSCYEVMEKNNTDFENIDFIISTVAIHVDYCPIVRVNFVFNEEDIEAVARLVNTNKVIKNLFFDQDLFLLFPSYSHKEDLLRKMVQQLENKHIVDSEYLQDILRREELKGTYIGGALAFPHAVNHHCSQSQIAVAILDKPLLWEDHKWVKIIFLLAADVQQTDLNDIYNLIIDIVNDDQFQKKIMSVQNFDEFMSVLFEH